jgi:hypothetical protein
MALIYQEKEKVVVLEMPCSLRYALKVVNSSMNNLILTILLESDIYKSRPSPDSYIYKSNLQIFEKGRDMISQLDKLFIYFYPYPRNFSEDKIRSSVRRFSLRCPAHIHKIVQDSALLHLMPLKEFIVKILINYMGRLLEEDPFSVNLKFQKAFYKDPHRPPPGMRAKIKKKNLTLIMIKK